MTTPKLQIKKTKITGRGNDYKRVASLIDKSKTIKDKILIKQEQTLYNSYITERQSMRKAHAFRKWKMFVDKHTK